MSLGDGGATSWDSRDGPKFSAYRCPLGPAEQGSQNLGKAAGRKKNLVKHRDGRVEIPYRADEPNHQLCLSPHGLICLSVSRETYRCPANQAFAVTEPPGQTQLVF